MSKKKMLEEKRIAIFVAHLGCPHDCAFCNQEKITGQRKNIYPSLADIEEKIEEQVATINLAKSRVEIAFFGGSFTGLPRDYQRELLDLAKHYVHKYNLAGIRFSTRPDYINEEIISFLSAYPIFAIELGVQSFKEEVLDAAGRGHSIEDIRRAMEKLKATGIELGVQLMAGLPMDTRESFLASIDQAIIYEADFVRIYPCLVLAETELAVKFQAGLYMPWCLEETIEILAEAIYKLIEAGIPLIRMGLQESEDLQRPGNVLAGPQHPNIRQEVEGRYFIKKIEEKLDLKIDSKNGKIVSKESIEKLNLYINPADETALRGQANKNLKSLEKKYNLVIIINKDYNVPRYTIGGI